MSGLNRAFGLIQFVYDPNTSTGSVAIQATRGTFRFVAGSQGGSYQIKTPMAPLAYAVDWCQRYDGFAEINLLYSRAGKVETTSGRTMTTTCEIVSAK